jgi:hypothetical protein
MTKRLMIIGLLMAGAASAQTKATKPFIPQPDRPLDTAWVFGGS